MMSFRGEKGRRALATRRFLQTLLQPFNAARPIDIMAATTSFSWVRSKPIRTTGESSCCLLAAATVDFLPPATFQRRLSPEKESGAQTCSPQAEAAFPAQPPQRNRCQGDPTLP